MASRKRPGRAGRPTSKRTPPPRRRPRDVTHAFAEQLLEQAARDLDEVFSVKRTSEAVEERRTGRWRTYRIEFAEAVAVDAFPTAARTIRDLFVKQYPNTPTRSRMVVDRYRDDEGRWQEDMFTIVSASTPAPAFNQIGGKLKRMQPHASGQWTTMIAVEFDFLEERSELVIDPFKPKRRRKASATVKGPYRDARGRFAKRPKRR